MQKDPRFNFYPDNWNGGTKRMTFEQKGAYVELLMLNFSCLSDGLPGFTKEEALAALAPAAAPAEMLAGLIAKFKFDGKFYCSQRLKKEVEKSQAFSQKQSERAKKRFSQKNESAMVSSAASSADDAINGTGIGIENGIESFGKSENLLSKESIFEALSADQDFMTALTKAHKGKDISEAFDACHIHHAASKDPPTTLQQWKQKLNSWLVKAPKKDAPNSGTIRTTSAVIGDKSYEAGLRGRRANGGRKK